MYVARKSLQKSPNELYFDMLRLTLNNGNFSASTARTKSKRHARVTYTTCTFRGDGKQEMTAISAFK